MMTTNKCNKIIMHWIQQDKGCRFPGILRAFATRTEVYSCMLKSSTYPYCEHLQSVLCHITYFTPSEFLVSGSMLMVLSDKNGLLYSRKCCICGIDRCYI